MKTIKYSLSALGLAIGMAATGLGMSVSAAELMTKSIADVIQHIFNHQAHHRGQLTCVLSQFDMDYGCMDLPVIVAEGSHAL